eukprot:CAMPEP_0194209404 /NCGR_PEP_ID=MMETSP0156-20130528/7541_1 /TAXON_ID=33649 /ORGANISM="Thalassionema nitzschioides, Strain L26-B" /LENGTH=1217 /DNA_ID=CAMNT_0038936571 /DNA_START=172 /DNA_END=3825 /DNA_ORIENTATION=-
MFTFVWVESFCLPRKHWRQISSRIITPTTQFASLELQEIQQRINQAAQHSVNVNSPQQVSHAIFGTPTHSTSRAKLQQIIASSSGKQKELARLVLQYRTLQQHQRRQLSTNDSSKRNNDNNYDDDALTVDRILDGPARHAETVKSLFHEDFSLMIDPYWKEPLSNIQKPVARALISQLNSRKCPTGYDPAAVPTHLLKTITTRTAPTKNTKSKLLEFVEEQKELYPQCILLVRVGNFYESFGLDAILLVEHCGLNSMGGRCRAGCPLGNIQATLDDLTRHNYKVAVIEEVEGTVAPDKSKGELKQRMMSQIVTCASPTYLYNLVLNDQDNRSSITESRPYMGVLATANQGYTLVEVSLEEQSVQISERLTPEAVTCRIRAYPPVNPLIYVGQRGKLPAFLASQKVKTIPSHLVEQQAVGGGGVERAKRVILRAILELEQQNESCMDDFRLLSSSTKSEVIQTKPLHFETAKQLGLMNDQAIPALVDSLVTNRSPASCKRFLRRWLLTPPPPHVADAMAIMVNYFQTKGSQSLPPTSYASVGKMVTLLRAQQASAFVYQELLQALDVALHLLKLPSSGDAQDGDFPLDAFMIVLEFETGIAAQPTSIQRRSLEVVSIIEGIISPLHHASSRTLDNNEDIDKMTDFGNVIPSAFWERNEADWRGRVRPSVCKDSYEKVQKSAEKLAKAVATDFWDEPDLSKVPDSKSKSPIVQDIFNNLIAIRDKDRPKDQKDRYFRPKDRNNKIIGNKYTTQGVQDAWDEYVKACEDARLNVEMALTNLSRRLCDEGHLPAIVQACHLNLILTTVTQHACQANHMGWSTVELVDESDVALHLRGVWPYWMGQCQAVSNTFDLKNMFLLTAPNMSGKSTVMRSTAAAALLASCGFCAPVEANSQVQRFDHVFVRGASSDIPTENLSAFGAEVLDIASLLCSGTTNSLVFVDELGRGTSPKDGTSIAAAVLEEMSNRGMSGIFATHLHDIIPLLKTENCDGIVNKRMVIRDDQHPTYLMEDGVCMDSQALETAARFGFPDNVLTRAKTFAKILDDGFEEENNDVEIDYNLVERCSHDDVSDEASNEITHSTKCMEDAILVASKVQGCEDEIPIKIRPKWTPPPSLEGRSCVYILAVPIRDDHSSNERHHFYVGETDSFLQRLSQHRRKKASKFDWSLASAAVFQIPGGKSDARLVESLVIRQLAQHGFDMISVADGMKLRPNTSSSQLSP